MSQFFASCARGLEDLLFDELRLIGVEDLKRTRAGVRFSGELDSAYRVCLWSRLAGRVLMPLDEFDGDPDRLYQGVRGFAWEEEMDSAGTLWIDFHGSDERIRHTQFGAQRIKDAIVDRFQELKNHRPTVDPQQPDLRLSARLLHGKVDLALDLSGDPLHRRGYRQRQGAAPLRETLAAALLMRAGWPNMPDHGTQLVDPMCGSGTLLIEGAMLALDRAPGLERQYWGFQGWLGHRPAIWKKLLHEAEQRYQQARENSSFNGMGRDADRQMVAIARDNISRAGLGDLIEVQAGDLQSWPERTSSEGGSSGEPEPTGLVITNPPYGERLGDRGQLKQTYRELGEFLKNHCPDWQAAVLTTDAELGHSIGLHSHRQHRFYNGTIECQLLRFEINPSNFRQDRRDAPMSEGSVMVANRLKKNQRKLAKWLKREQVQCYRLYDADLPEYSAAIDVYGDYVHLQEYAAPSNIEQSTARRRLNEIRTALERGLNIPEENIFLKQRQKQRGSNQYQREERPTDQFVEVAEDGARFWVNLADYLDTGLFLDHRPVRRMIRDMASGRRVLNLFCYTASATVMAAKGGATETVSVDLSNTYLNWAGRNFELNGMTWGHRLERADCRQWIASCTDKFDLIFLDPPTFSNSRQMEGVLDTQQDHQLLIDHALRCLSADGVLLFSTNYRRFKLDPILQERYRVEDISEQTIDPDFQRNSRIHKCWRIQHRDPSNVNFEQFVQAEAVKPGSKKRGSEKPGSEKPRDRSGMRSTGTGQPKRTGRSGSGRHPGSGRGTDNPWKKP